MITKSSLTLIFFEILRKFGGKLLPNLDQDQIWSEKK